MVEYNPQDRASTMWTCLLSKLDSSCTKNSAQRFTPLNVRNNISW